MASTNIIPIDFNEIPAFAKNKSAVAKALDDTLASGIKRLSIKGGTFRYVAGGQEIGKIEERFIDLVLVNAAPHISRTYYAKAFDGDAKPESPDCWSIAGDKPEEKARNKQHDNCLNCPQNQKGSGKGQSKACRYSQRLAVVLANDIEGEVLQLQLPATSLFGDASEAGASLQGYYKSLNARSIDPAALITRARFDTDSESPKLGFSALGWLTQAQYNTAIEKGKSEEAKRAITMTVFEIDGVDKIAAVPLPYGTPPVMAPPPAPAPAPAKPAAKKSDVKLDNDVPIPSGEPIVRKTVDAAAVTPEMAKIMAEWADDE